jgi:hypothetical protein
MDELILALDPDVMDAVKNWVISSTGVSLLAGQFSAGTDLAWQQSSRLPPGNDRPPRQEV